MKGGVVANLFALRALRAAGFVPRGDVVVECYVGTPPTPRSFRSRPISPLFQRRADR
jgi:hypothetical protein